MIGPDDPKLEDAKANERVAPLAGAHGSALETALLDAATTGNYVAIYLNPDRKWRVRVGDTAFIAESFAELATLLVECTARERAYAQNDPELSDAGE
jgi:hypothetical protein